MHRFLNSFEALLSIQLLVKCRNIILPTVMTPHEKYNHSPAQLFSMFNVVLTHVDYFQDIYYRNQAGFCFFWWKNLLADITLINSYTSQVQCTSLSRDKKFVTSLVQSAGLCSSRARWPLAPDFCPWATRKSQIFQTNHMMGTLNFTV